MASGVDISTLVSISLGIYKAFSIVKAETDSAGEYKKFAEDLEEFRESLANMALECGDEPDNFSPFEKPESYHFDAPLWSDLDIPSWSYRCSDIYPTSTLDFGLTNPPSSSLQETSLGSFSSVEPNMGELNSPWSIPSTYQLDDARYLSVLGQAPVLGENSMDARCNTAIVNDQMEGFRCKYRLPDSVELNSASVEGVDRVRGRGLPQDSASDMIGGIIAPSSCRPFMSSQGQPSLARKTHNGTQAHGINEVAYLSCCTCSSTFTGAYRRGNLARHNPARRMRQEHPATSDSGRLRHAGQIHRYQGQQKNAQCAQKLEGIWDDRNVWLYFHCGNPRQPNGGIQEYPREVEDSGQVSLTQVDPRTYPNTEQKMVSIYEASDKQLPYEAQYSKQVCSICLSSHTCSNTK